MIKPVIALTSILVVFGFLNNSNSLRTSGRPKESWVHDRAPSQVKDFVLRPDMAGSKISYTMGDVVYKELDPVGMACQIYNGPGGKSFDAVIVAGDRMESYHDQRWCFKAQGWDIKSEEDATLKTESHGEIPVKLVQIAQGNGPSTYAIFTFRGPSKFHSDIPGLSQDYFMHELLKQSKFIGTEYRIIPQYQHATKEEVKQFTADYIDATFKSSGGAL